MSLLELLETMYAYRYQYRGGVTEDVLISVFIITPSMLHLLAHLT
jgi:hypothetical protein